MAAKDDREFGKGKDDSLGKADFSIHQEVKDQRMEGFGASIMEAGLMTLNTLPAEKQEEVLRALFDPKDGAGFTAMKTPLAGTDFQSAGPWFTYDDTPGDVELKNFSVERDFGPNGVGTYILRARKYGNFALQAPMDYPPDWMLYDVKKRQDIPPKYYPVLANYFVKYLEEYKKHGIVVDYLSLFNEPEEVYTKIKYPENSRFDPRSCGAGASEVGADDQTDDQRGAGARCRSASLSCRARRSGSAQVRFGHCISRIRLQEFRQDCGAGKEVRAVSILDG